MRAATSPYMNDPSFGRSTRSAMNSEQLEILHRVAAEIHGAKNLEEILPAASRASRPALRHKVLALGLLDRRHGLLEIYSVRGGRTPRRLDVDSTALGPVLAHCEARVFESPGSPAAPGCTSIAAAPLWVRGRPGVLIVGSDESGWYTSEDLPLVEGLAGHVAVAFDRARLQEQEAYRVQQLRLVSDVAQAAVSTLESPVLLERIVDRIQEQFKKTHTSIWLHDVENGVLRLTAEGGISPQPLGHEFPSHRGIMGRALRKQEAVLVRDTRRDEDYVGDAGYRSELCVPIVSRGEVLAVLNVESDQADAFDEEEATALAAVAGLIAAALENGRLYQEVRAFNLTLSEQLSAATHDLEAANAEIAGQKRLLEVENRSLKKRLLVEQERLEIIGDSRVLRDALEMAERVGAAEATCLIQGESGTGKELFARLIHQVSPRTDEALVTVNCAAIPEQLLESTLFGHERGAFTDAIRDQQGLVEAAAGGTLFLDEIGEMSPALQAKLLRFLQSGEYYRVGGTDLRFADVRIISATNKDLKAAVDDGSFRGDLFFRVAALVIEIPPLRMRPEDIPLLVRHFLDRTDRGRGMRPTGELLQALEAYPWPGNIRELENAVSRLIVLADEPELGPDLLASHVLDEASLPPTSPPREPSLILSLQEMERAAVSRALARHRGNKKEAALDLGIALRTLYNKIERYSIPPARREDTLH